MVKITVYSAKGVKKGTTSLPSGLTAEENLPLLAQAIRVYGDRKHPGLSKVKTRGVVTGSTRKIYRQKGTGSARHGARNAPIFVGGGIAHGPKGIKRVLSLPAKMRRKAFRVALTLKAKEGNLIAIEAVSNFTKTKEIAHLIKTINPDMENSANNFRYTLVLSEKNRKVAKIARNIANLEVMPFRNLNAESVYLGGVIIIDQEAFTEKIDSQGKVKQSQKEVLQVKKELPIKTKKESKTSQTKKIRKVKKGAKK